VHIWSAPVWYLGRRGYQVVRSARPSGAFGVASAPPTVRGVTPARRPSVGVRASPAE
jgi:nitrate reductase gamma subunit